MKKMYQTELTSCSVSCTSFSTSSHTSRGRLRVLSGVSLRSRFRCACALTGLTRYRCWRSSPLRWITSVSSPLPTSPHRSSGRRPSQYSDMPASSTSLNEALPWFQPVLKPVCQCSSQLRADSESMVTPQLNRWPGTDSASSS